MLHILHCILVLHRAGILQISPELCSGDLQCAGTMQGDGGCEEEGSTLLHATLCAGSLLGTKTNKEPSANLQDLNGHLLMQRNQYKLLVVPAGCSTVSLSRSLSCFTLDRVQGPESHLAAMLMPGAGVLVLVIELQTNLRED